MSAPIRTIVGRELYRTPSHPRGAYSVMVLLDCGHSKHYKRSQEPRRTARCDECDQLQKGEVR